MYDNNELYHYGVPGMRWGHRKAQPFSAKATGHRIAAKLYDVNARTYAKSNRTLSSMNKAARTTQLKKAAAAQQAANAKSAVKKAKKQAINDTYNKLQSNASRKDKLLYNNATRKLAAKYVVNNKMSVADATKKANKAAIRNTAIVLGVYGAMTVRQLRNMR